MREGCDSIVLTLAQKTIKEYRGNYRGIVDTWQRCDGEGSIWYYRCGIAPKNFWEVEYVFWSVGGRIRWRSKLATVEHDKTYQFSPDGPKKWAKWWLLCFDFEQVPKRMQIEYQGFRGFRYFDSSKIPMP